MWKPIPNDVEQNRFFITSIIDDSGRIRNECRLQKIGRLWFLKDGTYVYYTPTHYIVD